MLHLSLIHILNVENGFNFSVSKEYYTGKYNYIITTVPSNAAQIKVNDEIYNGGLSELTNPANTKVNIKPTTSGKITLNPVSYTHLDVYKRQPFIFEPTYKR